MPEPATRSFYRAVSTAELAAIRTTGRLGPGVNSAGVGKHLWSTLDAAVAFRERVRALRWDPPAEQIICVEFTTEVAAAFTDLGPRLDGCGQAYYAGESALDCVLTIREIGS